MVRSVFFSSFKCNTRSNTGKASQIASNRKKWIENHRKSTNKANKWINAVNVCCFFSTRETESESKKKNKINKYGTENGQRKFCRAKRKANIVFSSAYTNISQRSFSIVFRFYYYYFYCSVSLFFVSFVRLLVCVRALILSSCSQFCPFYGDAFCYYTFHRRYAGRKLLPYCILIPLRKHTYSVRLFRRRKQRTSAQLFKQLFTSGTRNRESDAKKKVSTI